MSRKNSLLKLLLSALVLGLLLFYFNQKQDNNNQIPNNETPVQETTSEVPLSDLITSDKISDGRNFTQPTVNENNEYNSKEEVATYIHLYNHLPDNYITKSEAKKEGWVSSEGNLCDIASNLSIGGSSFSNREGILPTKEGRQYYECDIDYNCGYRNEKRIVYSNDGWIFYTGDHYASYELLFAGEN